MKLSRFLKAKKSATRSRPVIGGIFVFSLVLLGVTSIQTWEYSNSNSFCGDACHSVHPEEPAAFQDSYHASIQCTECHLGRSGTLKSMLVKAGHLRRLPDRLLGQYSRPTQSESLRPPTKSCERCHRPDAFHGDTVREITRYLPDENNSERRTFLILRTHGAEPGREPQNGVHWHIENKVEFIATDEHKQDIRWIRTTLPDGRTVEYNDVTNPLSADEFARAEVKVLDCLDCHNRVGHPFASPEQAIDTAIADGFLSRDLPYVKRELAEVLSATYPNQEAALAAVGEKIQEYRGKFPDVAAARGAEIDQAAVVAKDLVKRLVFEEAGFTWQSFPDNGQHKEFAGCFRCHDGDHQSPPGEPIRLQCNLCHSIPVTVDEGERPPDTPMVALEEPASHRNADFMRDHRFQANDSCADCHGEVTFGADDTSFCANSACHGQGWPEVELDAAFPHPIELEGKHAEAWCQECHQGTPQPAYECANCHEPPAQPHFGEACEACHTPQRFTPANIEGFQHPVPLEGEHAALDCEACHSGGQDLAFECQACHQPLTEPHFGETCQDCHTPEGFKPAQLNDFEHPVPLEGQHTDLDCATCHNVNRDLAYECAACHQPPENHFEATCDTCHTPQGWAESVTFITAKSPQIPHALEGMDQCLLCHDPAGKSRPAPADHKDFINEQCTLCHQEAP